jgi:hypothetical protein
MALDETKNSIATVGSETARAMIANLFNGEFMISP